MSHFHRHVSLAVLALSLLGAAGCGESGSSNDKEFPAATGAPPGAPVNSEEAVTPAPSKAK